MISRDEHWHNRRQKAERGDHLNTNRIKTVNLTDGLNRDHEWKSDYIFPSGWHLCKKGTLGERGAGPSNL